MQLSHVILHPGKLNVLKGSTNVMGRWNVEELMSEESDRENTVEEVAVVEQ